MKVTSDTLTVVFDSSSDDEAGICVSRVVNGKVVILKVELGEQADILYYLLTEQTAKAEIKTESEDWHDVPSDEMTLEQARQAVKDLRKYVMDNYILSKSVDAISRQAAKLKVARVVWEDGDSCYDFHDKCVDCLDDVSSVNPKQRTGHWIKTISENGITSAARCSECGFEDNRYMLFRYCPNCGCRMVESQESGEHASDIKVGDEVMTKTMEEIEIVLKISEEDYINLQKKNKLNDMFLNYYEKLIAHGTPLPKGHGDLIDRKELLNEAQADGAYGYISVKEIYDSEIIIKADKAESEGAEGDDDGKTGHWIRVDKDKLRCSECEVIHLIAQYPHGKIDWCPNCGARMVESQEKRGKRMTAEREKAINEWLGTHCPKCANNDDRGTDFLNCQAECEVQKDVGIACIHYEEYVAESEE